MIDTQDKTIIIRKSVKYFRIKVSADLNITIIAPKRASNSDIEKLIESKQKWIKDKINKFTLMRQKSLAQQFNEVELFGEKYYFSKVEKQKKLIYSHDTISISYYKDLNDRIELKKAYKMIAADYLRQRIYFLAQKHNIKFGKLSFRFQKSRWGSCNKKGDISLNCNLVRLSKEMIDYVLLHELTHTIHFNHSSLFWNKLSQFYPESVLMNSSLKKVSLLNL
jgi:predicted metal-dependent hydrolase